MEMGYPPERTWDQWKYYGMEIGYPLSLVNRQTPVKAVPRTTYAGGNNEEPCSGGSRIFATGASTPKEEGEPVI